MRKTGEDFAAKFALFCRRICYTTGVYGKPSERNTTHANEKYESDAERIDLSQGGGGLICALLLSFGGSAATLYVDNGMLGYDGHDGTSPALALRRIQEAIDKAADGDTILVAPGIYGEDQGLGRTGSAVAASGGHWWGSARILVANKSLHIKSTDGAEVTHIVGAHDSSSTLGLGDYAVRCIDVENSNSDKENVFEGFTLRNGATRESTNPSGRGGALHVSFDGNMPVSDKTFLVDCVVSNCVGAVEALALGGTFVRCRIQDNAFLASDMSSPNSASNHRLSNGTAFFNTLFGRNRTVDAATAKPVSEGTILLSPGGRFVNCTFACNLGRFYSLSFNDFRNTLVSGTQFDTYGGGRHQNRVDDTTATRNLIAPALGDVRLRTGAAATTAGDASLVADTKFVPFPTLFSVARFRDLYGANIPQTGAIAAGCSQTAVEPSAGAVVAKDRDVQFGETAFPQYEPSYVYPTDGTGTIRVRCELADGQRALWASVVRGQETVAFPLPADGAFEVTPPASVTETVTVAFERTSNVRYADPTVAESADQDGSAAKPYRTLAQALEALGGAAGAVIANPGVYDSGEMSTGDSRDVKARAVVPDGAVLAARDGWTNTFIKGAACQPSDQDKSNVALYADAIAGMGKSAVRGVYLAGFRAAVCGFTLTNCYVRGATDAGGGGHNNLDYCGAGVAGGGQAKNCRIVDCHAFRGGGAWQTTLVNCILERNTALYGGGASDDAKHYGCLSRENRSANVNTAADGLFYWNVCENGTLLDARTGGPKAAACMLKNTLVRSKMSRGDIPDDAIAPALFSHCAFAADMNGAQTGGFKNAIESGDGNVLVPSDALALDADGRPVIGACAAVDAGDAALNAAYVGETDLFGGPRVSNGALDIGALEGDWRAVYARAIRRSRVTVTEASPSVTTNADGKVVLTDGARLMALVQGTAGFRYLLRGRVTGGGTLTVTVDGVSSVCTADAELNLMPAGETCALAFAYTGSGEAVIDGLKRAGGLLFVVR